MFFRFYNKFKKTCFYFFVKMMNINNIIKSSACNVMIFSFEEEFAVTVNNVVIIIM